MERVVSATEARVHFGEMMRQAVETDQPIIVQRDGKEQVVILSVEQYRKLQAAKGESSDWWQRLHDLHRRIEKERAGRPVPDPADIIREMREERSREFEELLGLR